MYSFNPSLFALCLTSYAPINIMSYCCWQIQQIPMWSLVLVNAPWLIAQLANSVTSQSCDCPHKADYCDTCSKHKNEMNAKQTTMNRLRQSSNADPAEIKKVEDELRRKMSSIDKMQSERTSTTLKWSVAVPQNGRRFVNLKKNATLSNDEKEKLGGLKNKFNLVLCADYQQCKLVLFWGMSPQPGSTYYLQKLNHDVFGTVNHGLIQFISSMKLWDQRIQITQSHTSHTTLAHSLLGSNAFTYFLIMPRALIRTFVPWRGH